MRVQNIVRNKLVIDFADYIKGFAALKALALVAQGPWSRAVSKDGCTSPQ